MKRKNALPIYLIFILCYLVIASCNPSHNPTIVLTEQEKEWLRENNGKLVLSSDPFFPPMEYYDENNQFSGISSDLIKIISKKLNLKFEIKRIDSWEDVEIQGENKQIDILPCMQSIERRKKYWLFTEPYLNLETVVLLNKNNTQIKTQSDLKNKRVAVVKNYAVADFVSQRYAESDIVFVKNTQDGVTKLSFNSVDAMVTDIPTATFYNGIEAIQNLKIAFNSGFTYHLAIASRNDLPILNVILQKALNSITPEEKASIISKWIKIEYKRFYETWQFWLICISSIFIISFLLWTIKIWIGRAEELKRAKERADVANKSKSEFLANMSHEIRTPMNAILGFTDLMLEEETDEDKRTYLKYISTSGHNLLKLINDILDLAKIESGKLTVSATSCKISELFTQMRELFFITAKDKGISIEIILPPQMPEFILIDEVRLRQVMFNLIGNAIKFTNKGAVTIEIFSQEIEPKTISLTIKVIDTGIGIPENEIENIFNPFEQVMNQNFAKYGGTGLGLAITKRLVEIMKGKITVSSQVNQGSTFEINFQHLPVLVSEEKTSEFPVPNYCESLKNKSILIIEDNEINKAFIAEIFKSFQVKIIMATEGNEALEHLKDFLPDIILSDIRMPGMDGLSFIHEIKKDKVFKTIPIIAISASVMTDQVQSVLDAGFDAFIRKPISKFELLNSIIKLIEKK